MGHTFLSLNLVIAQLTTTAENSYASTCRLSRIVNIGWPGKTHDARMFANSSVYTDIISVPQLDKKNCVPLIILGDPAYPLLPWLIKPYIENSSSTPEEHTFNYRQSRARMVVENAFGLLKGRWRCLLDGELGNCTCERTAVRSGLLNKRVFIDHHSCIHTRCNKRTFR